MSRDLLPPERRGNHDLPPPPGEHRDRTPPPLDDRAGSWEARHQRGTDPGRLPAAPRRTPTTDPQHDLTTGPRDEPQREPRREPTAQPRHELTAEPRRELTAEPRHETTAGLWRGLAAEWRRYLRAEWTKLRTATETVWLVLGIVAATVGVGIVVVLNIPCTTEFCGGDPTKTGLTGVQLGQAVVAILAVLAVGGEYSTGMIHGTLAAMPRRTGVLAAKAVVVTAVIAPAAAVAVAVSALTGRHFLPADASWPSVLRATGGSVLYLMLIGLLALGVATVVRNAAAAVGVVLALLFLFPILAAAAPDPTWERHLLQVGPMTAGLAVQATTGLDKLPIGPWAGLAVTAAWAVGALLAAVIALEARDA
ncbi:hypothetical protein ACQEVZ_52900 [Dactylosporangium sp. CA-152071]|uniref:hypothetical protein n=1 Tax=Dactylosporangium sp. CA-152071 TaxID=3239933 RepID=UPI003D8D9217